MKRYNTYKPSEIEWLGDIPEHWEVKRVKEIGNVVLGKMLCNTPQSGYLLKPYLKSKNIGWIKVNMDSVEEMYFSKAEMKQYKVKENDLLLSEGGEVGKTCIWKNEIQECYIQNSVHKISFSKSIEPRYFLYFSFATGVLGGYDSIVSFISIKHLTYEKLNRVLWAVPPLSEQTAIANYLDTKTAAIDRKIELLTAKANKYKALRRSLINETVCRGLNPNAPLKDSCIEWIGKIPEHWDEYRMKDLGFLYSGLSGKAGDDFNQDENENNCDFIPFTNIFNNDTINPDIMGKVVVFENEKQNKVKKDDLFFLMSSEDYDGLGKSSLLAINLKNTYLNSFCKGYRITNKNVFPAFLNYQLQSDTFRKVMQIEGKGFTRLNLKSEKVTDFKVFIPYTVEEQQSIVDFLDSKTTQIDTILTNISEQISKLTQLRKTLINDVVTGRIKVTD